ncbi:MAG: DUF354 domain-containing protein [Cyanobacteria bacterium]|nr:DUF354 domain-containing protein [Cyanobacteriota bacterium]
MKILIDINHPAHVHFFKNFIWEAQKRGHKTFITAINKDIALNLLEEYGFEYLNLGNYNKSLLSKIANIPLKDIQLLKAISDYKPDIMLGIASFKIAHAGWIKGVKSIIFDDTEQSTGEIMLYKPFVTKIFTPSCFKKNLGNKQIRYNGYHELAYLHPKRFKPDGKILKEIGLNPSLPFTIIRFVSWNAGHDIGHKGLSLSTKVELIKQIQRFSRVLITSENKLPREFEKFRLNISPSKIHHLMYFAKLVYGESATMASEAACLGVHSIFCDFNGRSYTDEEEKSYGLVYNFKLNNENQRKSIEKAIELLSIKKIAETGREKAKKMLSEKIDVTDYMLKKIINKK